MKNFNLITNFRTLAIIEKLLLIISALIFSYLFIQNFLFSKSFDLLLFREVDDVAFQASLRYAHNEILKFHLDKLLGLNDYGYGWLFWFPMVIITFPFYLLNHLIPIDFLLIIIPRQLSLIFSFATIYILYKSLSIYIKSEWVRFYSILLFLSFPTFGYFSMRFGTVSQVMFFSCLTFYLTIRNQKLERKDLKYIAISLAAAGGTKLSGLLISPLIFLVIADRYKWKINKENLKDASYFLVYLLGFLIIFSNPFLITAPFRTDRLMDYLNSLAFVMNISKTNLGGHVSFLSNFKYSVASATVHVYVIIAAYIMLFVNGLLNIRFNKENRKFDFIYIFSTLILVTIYLVFTMVSGIVNYFSVISFLLIFSFAIFDNYKNKFVLVLPIALVITNFIINYDKIFDIKEYNGGFNYNSYYKKYTSPNMKSKMQLQKEMQHMVGSPKEYKNKLRIVQDYQAPTIYGNFNDNIEVVYLFNNINTIDHIKYDFDYILLSKDAVYFIPQDKFDEMVKNSDKEVGERYLESRKIITQLLKNKTYKGLKYQLILDKGGIMLFKKYIN